MPIRVRYNPSVLPALRTVRIGSHPPSLRTVTRGCSVRSGPALAQGAAVCPAGGGRECAEPGGSRRSRLGPRRCLARTRLTYRFRLQLGSRASTSAPSGWPTFPTSQSGSLAVPGSWPEQARCSRPRTSGNAKRCCCMAWQVLEKIAYALELAYRHEQAFGALVWWQAPSRARTPSACVTSRWHWRPSLRALSWCRRSGARRRGSRPRGPARPACRGGPGPTWWSRPAGGILRAGRVGTCPGAVSQGASATFLVRGARRPERSEPIRVASAARV